MIDSAPISLPSDLDAVVAAAIREDVGDGDLTANLIPEERERRAEVVCRESAVLAGGPWFERVFAALDRRIDIEWCFKDGDELSPDSIVCRLAGPARGIVTGERTALNFLQTLSGTATVTRAYARLLAGTSTRILDTRKTLPALRSAQKYAVRCGGGYNHRMGLYDAVLIKENHIAAAGSIAAAVTAIRAEHTDIPIEVEVESMQELDEALAVEVDMVLLDNFDRDAVASARDRIAGRAKIEVSGGIEMADLGSVAEAGADFVSVGALTKHVHAIDFSMRVVAE